MSKRDRRSSAGERFGRRLGGCRDSTVNVGAADPVMGHSTEGGRAACPNQNPALFEADRKCCRVLGTARDVEYDHIGASFHGTHLDSRYQRESLGQSARIQTYLGI